MLSQIDLICIDILWAGINNLLHAWFFGISVPIIQVPHKFVDQSNLRQQSGGPIRWFLCYNVNWQYYGCYVFVAFEMISFKHLVNVDDKL